MDEVTIAEIIFEGLHPHFMMAMTSLLSGIYLFKYMCVKECDIPGGPLRRRPIYLLRAFLWGLFALVWFLFPFLGLITVRSLLRAMIAIIVLTEIAYDLLYIKDALKESWRWIYRKFSQIRR